MNGVAKRLHSPPTDFDLVKAFEAIGFDKYTILLVATYFKWWLERELKWQADFATSDRGNDSLREIAGEARVHYETLIRQFEKEIITQVRKRGATIQAIHIPGQSEGPE